MGLAPVAFALLYGLVLLVNGPFNDHIVFPFERWELFSQVPPATNQSFSIRFSRSMAHPVDPMYFDAAGAYVSLPQSPVASQLMREIGSGLVRHDQTRVVNAQRLFEARFMPNIRTARYEVVRRTFRILDRRKSNCFLSEEVVGVLEKKPSQ